jgi:hypothetical protein
MNAMLAYHKRDVVVTGGRAAAGFRRHEDWPIGEELAPPNVLWGRSWWWRCLRA